MIEIVLKILFLTIAICYSFTCFARLVRGQAVSGAQTWLMAVGIVGFVALQFWL